MLFSSPARVLKLSLCAILTLSLSGLPGLAAATAAGPPASLEGHVVSLAGDVPVAGVILRASTAGGETIYRSGATDEQGHFALRDLPAGNYGLAVETEAGVYESPGTVSLAPGSSGQVLLGLAPAKNEDEVRPGVVDEEEEDRRRGMTVLKNPLAMTLIALGGLTLLAWGIEENEDRDDGSDEEPTESPSSP
jgi:hypothetical protein